MGGEPAEEAEQLGGADGAGDPREAEAGAGPGDRVADRQVGGGGDCESGGVREDGGQQDQANTR